jgi:hypothetical protein
MQPTAIRTSRLLAALAVAALVIAFPSASHAKKPKRTVSATVNGVRVKWKGHRYVLFDDTPGHGFSLVATKYLAKKTVGFGCPIDVFTESFPLTRTDCLGGTYATRSRGGHVSTWLNTGFDPNNPITVTFQSFDGSVVQGTFSMTLTSASFDGTTVSIQGSFKGPLRQ